MENQKYIDHRAKDLGLENLRKFCTLWCIFTAITLNICLVEAETLGERYQFNITHQMLGSALAEFAKQANVQLLFPYDLAESTDINPVVGHYTVAQALEIMLRNTGFSGVITKRGIVTVTRIDKDKKPENDMRAVNKKTTLLGGIVGIFASMLGANEATADTTNTSTKSVTLQEVVVSARRTEESLQSTPVSIVALDGGQLEAMGINDLGTISAFVPNLSTGGTMGDGGNVATFTIRGIGGGQGFISQESSVGVYIDDIYFPRPNGGFLDLVDIDHIEVLRGPQGTLFGRNTSGGAVRYVTKKPEHEFSGKVKGALGNLERRDVTGIVNIPLSEAVASRLTFASKQQGGFIKRLNDGDKTGAKDVALARGQLRWEPNEDWTTDLSVDTLKVDNNGVAADIPYIDPTDFAPSQLGDPSYTADLVTRDPFTVVGGEPERSEYESWGFTGSLEHRLTENLSIKSLTGYRKATHFQHLDWDRTPAKVWGHTEDIDIEYYSEELQLNGTSFDERLNWVAGLYYLHEMSYQNRKRNTGYEPPNRLEIRDVDTKSYAIFGQGTFNITDKLSTTVGLRWSLDDKYLFAQRGDPSGENSDEWSSVSPRLGLEYQATDDLMVYLSAAKGFRAGGFNDSPIPNAPNDGVVPFAPETLWTYETGFRSEFFDNRVRLNGSFFYTDYTDIQVQIIVFDEARDVTYQVTQNAGSATVKGVELESQILLTDNLMVHGAFGWTDAAYTDVGGSPALGLDTPFQFTPEYAYTLGATYTQPLASGSTVDMNLDYGWKDSMTNSNTDSNAKVLPSYGLVNARLAYKSADDRWSVALFGTNLTDKKYLIGAFEASLKNNFSGFIADYYGRPREWGVEITANF